MVLVNVGKYTFVPWMPCGFLYVPLWRWFPTNVSSDDGKHVVFCFFLCGKQFPRSFSSFVGGPAADRSETVASLLSSQRIIPLAKTSGDDLRLGWIGAYKESNLLFRHHRPSRCKKKWNFFWCWHENYTLADENFRFHRVHFFFFGSFVACSARSCAGCSQGWNYFVFCSGLMQLGLKSWVPGGFRYFIFSPNRKGKWSNYIQLDSYFFRWVDKNPPTVDVLFILKNRLLWYPPQKTSEDDPTKLEKENHVQ